jgi:hypothetical protein
MGPKNKNVAAPLHALEGVDVPSTAASLAPPYAADVLRLNPHESAVFRFFGAPLPPVMSALWR